MMRFKDRIKAYIVKIIREEMAELENRESLLEENVRNLNTAIEVQETIAENVRNLNAAMEGQEVMAENVRNLNAIVAGYSSLEENVRNLNAAMEGQGALAENVRNLNTAVESYSSLAENVRNLNAAMEGQEVMAENVRNLNAIVEGYNSLEENVRNLNAAMEGQEALAENVRNLNAMTEGYSGLEENVRNLNAMMEGQEAMAENIRNLNTMLRGYENVIENIKNNNVMIEKIHSTLEMQKVKLAMLDKANAVRHSGPDLSGNGIRKAGEEDFVPAENIYSGIDYFDFENYFRGSMELIKRNQRQYIKYYKGRSNVVDLGCGRGEFLELLKENGIAAKGVDLYGEFVEMCKMKGLDVSCGDALHFLGAQQSVGGIFAGQLIEHLPVSQLVKLCSLAYEKLEEGAYMVMETPNPTCLSIFSHAFYVDPSHNKPVHPLTIKYILERSGFTDVEIIYTDTSRHTSFIPAISGIEDADEFNNAMHTVSEMLFGSQDYAAVARKHSSRLGNH